MDQMREYTIKILKDLIEACRDEYQLFDSASKNIDNEILKNTFTKYAQEKEQHMIKLQCEVRRLGGDLDDLNSNINAGPSFLDIKLNSDTKKLLSECVRRDAAAMELYSSAIQEDILWEVIPLVAKQYFGSKNIHEQIFNIINQTIDNPKKSYAQVPVS